MKRLKIKNTGDLFTLDDADFEKAKHCSWNLCSDGRLRNVQSLTLEEYCGITGSRGANKTLNFSRSLYG